MNSSKKCNYNNPEYEALDNKSAKSAAIAWGSGFYKLSRWRKLRHQAFKIYGKKCHCCDAGEEHPHVDHIKPRSKFPLLAFDITNLQILCRSCNSKKGNHVFIDYRSHKHKHVAESLVRNNQLKKERELYKQKKIPYAVIRQRFEHLNGKTKYELTLNLNNLIASLQTKYSKEVVDKIITKQDEKIKEKFKRIAGNNKKVYVDTQKYNNRHESKKVKVTYRASGRNKSRN
jgi:5-methylcytosine-specific restriction endonuclease McrA